MESLTVGFAILLAIKDQSTMGILYGSILALALFATAGILKRRSGFYVGSFLQVFVIAFGLFVSSFFIMGVVFAGLWAAAIIVGQKGEAARAKLMASQPQKD
jgi:hypothetical protein